MTSKMRPTVKALVAVSVDMKVTGFPVDLDQYYGLAAEMGTDASISGSNTYVSGYKPFWRPESPEDMRSKGDPTLPYAFLVDSRGRTEGLLHLHRGSGYCRDVVVLHAQDTPSEFIRYLDDRHYPHHAFGNGHVDLSAALTFIASHYDVKCLRVDAGGILISELLRQGLCDELLLLVHPCITGDSLDNEEGGTLKETAEGHLMTGSPRPLFTPGLQTKGLFLIGTEELSQGKMLIHYSVI
ncbi:MAG: dihydrofolate reductase family protein [Candidatus Methanomethylophilaceae archaeon]